MDTTFIIDDLVDWLKEQIELAHSKGVVFGLSGGLDSAVLAAISKKAFGKNALPIIMPIESNKKDEVDALKIIEAYQLPYEKVDLTEVYRHYMQCVIPPTNQMAPSNIKPRLRMMTLYYYAQTMNYLVLGSSNYSEFMTGYFTKYGDSGADLIPLGNFTKTEVYELAKELSVPEDIIRKKPSAGLWKEQTDEEELGFPYSELDAYLRYGEVGKNNEKIQSMIQSSQHKRMFAKIYKFNRK